MIRLDTLFMVSADPSLYMYTAYDGRLVALSIFIACISSILALQVVNLARQAVVPFQRQMAILSGSLALGVGIWSMHFIGMLALRLCTPVSYGLSMTLLSMLPSLFASWVGLSLLARSRTGWRQLVVGGTLVGSGIGAMHYSGMAAMVMAPSLRFDPWWFALSLLVAIVLAILALWIRYSELSGRLGSYRSLLLAGIVMGCATAGMHYSGMVAARFVGTPLSETPLAPSSTTMLAFAVTIATLLLSLVVVATNAFVRYRELAFATMQSRAEIAALVENLTDAVITIDERGIIRSVNPAVTRLLGYAPDEIIGQNVSMFMPEPHRTAHDGYLQRYLQTGEASIIGKGRYTEARRKDGELVPVSLAVSEYLILNRRFFSGTLHDLREQKHLMEAEQARRVAETSNHAKSEFLSRMSHELRTPLNAILGFGQLLETEPDHPLTATQLDSVREILHAGNHLLELVNEVLDLSRIESGRLDVSLEPVSVALLAEACLAQIKPLAAQRGIGVTLELDAPCAVQADRTRLKQVLLNLLSNAVKYNREGGSIRVRCAPSGEQRLRISVRDSGRGIAVDALPRLFKPFERLESAYEGIEGTGIGLALSKNLVEAMHGTIGVETVQGEGSTFWFELPMAAESEVVDEPAAISAPTVQTQPRCCRHRVLCIEDNAANLHLVQKIVATRKDIDLLDAGTAEAGLEIAASQRPDLILLDINLPGMDGFEALRRLRENPVTRTIPVVAITANAMARDIERGRAAGFEAYLTKPIVVSEFFGMIDRCLPASTENKA